MDTCCALPVSSWSIDRTCGCKRKGRSILSKCYGPLPTRLSVSYVFVTVSLCHYAVAAYAVLSSTARALISSASSLTHAFLKTNSPRSCEDERDPRAPWDNPTCARVGKGLQYNDEERVGSVDLVEWYHPNGNSHFKFPTKFAISQCNVKEWERRLESNITKFVIS